MALNLGSLNKSRQSSFGGNGGGSENVAVMIAEIHLADKTKKTINVAEDYATAYLLEDAFGLKAEFKERDPNLSEEEDHEAGTPLTAVKIKMRARNLKGEHTPMEIWDLQVGKRKGAALPMGEYPTVILENAWLDSRTNTVLVGWLTVAQRGYNETTTRALPGVLTTVEKETYITTDGGERNYRQNRYVAMPSEARTFDGIESFTASAIDFLQPNPEAAAGQPIATIRIVDNDSVVDPSRATDIAVTTIYPAWDKEARTYASPEASVQAWLSNPKNADWVSYIEQSGSTPGYTFELIPGYRYNTGRDSLPSKRGKGMDDADSFRIPVEDRENGNSPIAKPNGDGFLMTSGYAQGTVMVRSKETDAGIEWYATKTFRKSRFGAIYMRDELVTPNLPADVAASFEAAAVARGEQARKNLNQQRENTRSAQDNDEIPFGEPDHSGGLTPQ